MTERPWESDDDREQVQKRQESDKALTGCLGFFFVGLFLVVLVVVLAVLGVF